MSETAAEMVRSADFSPCRKYRYSLRRRWGDGPAWLMVMLNPSVADEHQDDATTRFCMNRARERGFGSYEAVNLFALIGTDPQCLRIARHPVGKDNDHAILAARCRADIIVVAWGDVHWAHRFPLLSRRQSEVSDMLRDGETYCFGLTKHGYPRFPRAIKRDVELERYP